jgi:transposase
VASGSVPNSGSTSTPCGGWVKQAQIDSGATPGLRSDERRRIAELERENRELRRANAILKTVSAFFVAELDRPSPRS